MKKDFYKATEKYLYNHPRMVKSLENLKLQIEEVEPEGPGGVSFGGVGEQNHIANPTQNEAFQIMETKEVLEKQIEKTKCKIGLIKKCYNNLEELEKKIINWFYFEQKKLREISNNTGYSVRQVSRIKRKSIKKMELELFGDTE